MHRFTLLGALALALVPLLTLSGCAPERPVPFSSSSQPAPPGVWQALPKGPLTARYGSVAAWVGDRFLVVGGATGQACPATASCQGEPGPVLADGVAYDPDARTWERISPAPVPIVDVVNAVTGTHLYLETWDPDEPEIRHYLRYDSETDRWTTLPAPPGSAVDFTVAGDRLVSTSYARDGEGRIDAVLAKDGRTWEPLPVDPLGDGSSRQMVWFDGALLLFARPDGVKEASPVLAARLDGFETWTRLPSIRTVGLAPVVVGDRVVFPLRGFTNVDPDFPYGGVYDPADHSLTALPVSDARTDLALADVRGVLEGGRVLSGGLIYDVEDGSYSTVRRPPGEPSIDPAAAASPTSVLVWGGGSVSSTSNRDDGWFLRIAR